MTAKRKKVPNYSHLNERLVIDQYHEICMCPSCHTMLDAPGATLPTCSCGTDEMPLGEEIRLTVDVRSTNARTVHVFGDGKSETVLLAIVFREDGKKTEHELNMNASCLTKYYEVSGLNPMQRYTTEWIGTIMSFVLGKLRNVT